MDLTKYAALDVKITEYSKVNNQFSLGRCRVFYEGPNVNRTIIDSNTAKELIKTIPGTPIVGRFNTENDDFEGHGEGQIAYGFVPLDPNPMKVEVTEEVYGLPVKRTYYEVDAVIWDGRFPEAKKVLDEEKSLSMELNPDTLDGEFEIYDDKHYLKITNAEFFGITILGDEHTPCFKDAKFLQAYTSMLSAYEATKGQESNIGGTDMNENVEVIENDTTIVNEEAVATEEVVEETVEETVAETEEVVENESEETPAEEGIEEGADEFEADETETTEEEETTEEVEETTEEVEEEAEENSADSEDEPEVEEESEAETISKEEFEALNAKIEELNSKLEVYENAAKEELVTKFSSKINDSEFMNNIQEKLSDYSVEDLKSTLGAKLAEQVLTEETTDEEKVNGMVYSFNGVAKKETKTGWQELVRATKNASNLK